MPGETIRALLDKAIAFLEEREVTDAKRSAELLLCNVLNCKRIDLYLRYDQPLNEEEIELYRQRVRRRIKREPLQYILGETEFYGRSFLVTRDVLIPRPETEHLVEKAIEKAKTIPETSGQLTVLDIGTGSGIIPVTLAKHLPGARITAIDVSEKALLVAAENAERHGVSEYVSFVKHDILSAEPLPFAYQFHLIVSNPPYIHPEEYSGLQPEVRDYEPRIALTDELDGLTFFRRIAELSSSLLLPKGKVLLEIGFGQSSLVSLIFKSVGFGNIELFKDYSGIDRVFSATVSP